MDAPRWLTKWQGHVHTEDDLVRFVDDVGFCTINELAKFPDFPSQQAAMDRQDVLGYTWFWKDDLHIQKRIFYTRLFTGKPGYISLSFLPAFIATNGEVADELFMYGKLSATAQDIYSIIEERGPISGKNLKALLGPDARKASAGILIDLERKFLITKTGITGRERGTYGYIWDLAERWVPEAFEDADKLGVRAARERVLAELSELGVPFNEKFKLRVLGWSE